ncbi:MAG: 3-dehydroquinate dehydratase [Acidimicrobiales bacterium]|nr:3-dehydroquinate dehydratase [Acidimicrobiales bacterium]
MNDSDLRQPGAQAGGGDPGRDPVILLLSGPNLQLLGQREPAVYGEATLEDYVGAVRERAASAGITVEHVQSNHEGDLVDAICAARDRCAAIIINPAAFTHYSWAIHDALAAFEGIVIEVHISNPAARQAWRHQSTVSPVATGVIMGLGIDGYVLAVDAVVRRLGRSGSVSS